MKKKIEYDVHVMCSECKGELEFKIEQTTEKSITIYVKPCEECTDDAIIKYCERL